MPSCGAWCSGLVGEAARNDEAPDRPRQAVRGIVLTKRFLALDRRREALPVGGGDPEDEALAVVLGVAGQVHTESGAGLHALASGRAAVGGLPPVIRHGLSRSLA